MSRIKTLLSALQSLDIPRSQPPLLTFPLLTNFPLELRNMIWAQAAYERRRINILRLNEDCARQSLEVEGQRTHPGIIHACSESRKEALQHYQQHSQLCRIGHQDGKNILHRRIVFMNKKADTIILAIPMTIRLSAAQTYLNLSAFNLRPEAIRDIKNMEFQIGSIRSTATELILNRFLPLLHKEARVANIKFTFESMWDDLDLSSFILRDFARRKVNEWYEKYVRDMVKKDQAIPALGTSCGAG